MNHYEDRLSKLEKESARHQQKAELLSDIVYQSNHVIADLASRLDGVELNQAKRSAVLTGLSFAKSKKDRLEQLIEFFRDTLDTEPSIDDSFPAGGC